MTKKIKKPVIAGNWKMHKGPAATREFALALAPLIPKGSGATIILFPPAISLTTALSTLEETGIAEQVEVGAQNIHWEDEGAFTGEISAEMAREVGASYALIGHSERRHLFGETNDETSLKVRAALQNELRPMICVGETKEEREEGRLEEVITTQLIAAIEGLEKGEIEQIAIAYEPVWAIGTGLTATPDDAAEAHQILRNKLAQAIGTTGAEGVPILYGGSVRPENAADLCAANEVDGLLIGGASLQPESFAAIIEAATKG